MATRQFTLTVTAQFDDEVASDKGYYSAKVLRDETILVGLDPRDPDRVIVGKEANAITKGGFNMFALTAERINEALARTPADIKAEYNALNAKRSLTKADRKRLSELMAELIALAK